MQETQTTNQASLTSLVTGIVNDSQQLMKQQLTLFKHEMHEDYRKTKQASADFAVSIGLGVIGVFLLVAMLVGLLAWLVPALPWWGWCGILGGLAVVTAVILWYAGANKFKSFNPLPDESVQAAKENLQWITRPQ